MAEITDRMDSKMVDCLVAVSELQQEFGWRRMVEVLRDVSIAQAALQHGPDREILYHVSKLFDGMMGLTKRLSEPLPSVAKFIHLAVSVRDEDDFGKLTFCGVVEDDRSAIAPSQMNTEYPAWRVCPTCKERWNHGTRSR